VDAHVVDWLGLALRWFHVLAGIAWIGTSLYYMWLDSAIGPPARPRPGLEGEAWLVHSGGFYRVEKLRPGPGEIPAALHWFKWEAALTWISGVLLLAAVYYLTGGVYLVDPGVSRIGLGAAVAVGVGFLVLAWLVYDLVWTSPLAGRPALATAVSGLLLLVATYGLTRVLSGRGAFLHVGAMLGTLMVANVWMRILPAQREMIAASRAGRAPDFTLGTRAKTRSVHNSYMTFPVVFLMLSPHYPATYGHPWSWLVLGLFFLAGAAVRHAMIVGGRRAAWGLVPAAAAVAALVVMTRPAGPAAGATGAGRVPFAAVRTVVNQRCLACHSRTPLDATFGATPGGVSFDTPESLRSFAARIKVRAVDSHTMPIANRTGITPEERALLGRWVDQGARLE
jgi:uncharacterized membrane protein